MKKKAEDWDISKEVKDEYNPEATTDAIIKAQERLLKLITLSKSIKNGNDPRLKDLDKQMAEASKEMQTALAYIGNAKIIKQSKKMPDGEIINNIVKMYLDRR